MTIIFRMHIFFRDIQNNFFEVDVPDDYDIPKLKNHLAELKHTTPDAIKLIFSSKVLQDTTDLQKIQTNENSRIAVYIRTERSQAKPAEQKQETPKTENPPLQPKPAPVQTHKPAPQQYQPPQQFQQTYSPNDQGLDSFRLATPTEDAINSLVEMGYARDVAFKVLQITTNNPQKAVDLLANGFDTIEKIYMLIQQAMVMYRSKNTQTMKNYSTTTNPVIESIYQQIITNPVLIQYVLTQGHCPVNSDGQIVTLEIDRNDFVKYCRQHGVNMDQHTVLMETFSENHLDNLNPQQTQLLNKLTLEFPHVDQITILQYLQACDFDEGNTRACLQAEI